MQHPHCFTTQIEKFTIEKVDYRLEYVIDTRNSEEAKKMRFRLLFFLIKSKVGKPSSQ